MTSKKNEPESSSASMGHNPFASLSALKSSLPDVPVVEKAAEKKEPKKFEEKLVVRKEKKGHGGKTVTVVSGVVHNYRDEICTALKKSLGTGARVDDEGAIVVQGDVVDRVIAALEKVGAKKVIKGSG